MDKTDIRTSGAKGKMQVRADAPAGLEQDARGNVIPFAQRTSDHRRDAMNEGHETDAAAPTDSIQTGVVKGGVQTKDSKVPSGN